MLSIIMLSILFSISLIFYINLNNFLASEKNFKYFSLYYTKIENDHILSIYFNGSIPNLRCKIGGGKFKIFKILLKLKTDNDILTYFKYDFYIMKHKVDIINIIKLNNPRIYNDYLLYLRKEKLKKII